MNNAKINMKELLMQSLKNRQGVAGQEVERKGLVEFKGIGNLIYDASGHMSGVEDITAMIEKMPVSELIAVLNHEFTNNKEIVNSKTKIIDKFDGCRSSIMVSNSSIKVRFVPNLEYESTNYANQTIIKMSEKPWLFM